MKIKRYQAPDMRTAIRKVRDELGSDAVILSNQKINGQTEIVAAIEYDESLFNDMYPASAEDRSADVDRSEAINDIKYGRNIPQQPATQQVSFGTPSASVPGNMAELTDMQKELKELRGLLMNQMSGLAWHDELRNHPLRARLMQRLIAFGLSPSLANQIADQADKDKDFEHNWRHALALIAHRIKVTNDDILNHGGVVALIGSTGVGKTTSVAKLAAQYILRHGQGRVALISTDSYRIAAHEQLRTFARILGVPMYVATDTEQLERVLNTLHDKDLVLIDTAGMSQRDLRLCEQFSLFRNEVRIRTYLVMAANTQRSVIDDVTNACQRVDIDGCIMTKVDETTSFGGALSVAIEHNLPVAYVSDGQRVPEDLHIAHAHTLVSRSVAIMHEVAAQKKNNEVPLSISGMVAHAHG